MLYLIKQTIHGWKIKKMCICVAKWKKRRFIWKADEQLKLLKKPNPHPNPIPNPNDNPNPNPKVYLDSWYPAETLKKKNNITS